VARRPARAAVPVGGSVYLLLWSNYGAKKAGAIYGVAFFGFSFLIGVFWWFGGPGIPPGLGISHLPGQTGDHYQERWYAFEAGSERAEFFPGADNPDEFVTVEEYAGLEGPTRTASGRPAVRLAVGLGRAGRRGMQEQFLPIDENGVAQIGAERRAGLEEDAPPSSSRRAAGRAQPFYTVRQVEEPRVRRRPGDRRAAGDPQFQVFANFVDDDGVPLEPVPVGSRSLVRVLRPGCGTWLPSALWTVISLVLFLLSLFWLDRLEMRDKRLATVEVEEPRTWPSRSPSSAGGLDGPDAGRSGLAPGRSARHPRGTLSTAWQRARRDTAGPGRRLGPP
jgi:hypothetical protein